MKIRNGIYELLRTRVLFFNEPSLAGTRLNERVPTSAETVEMVLLILSVSFLFFRQMKSLFSVGLSNKSPSLTIQLNILIQSLRHQNFFPRILRRLFPFVGETAIPMHFLVGKITCIVIIHGKRFD